MGEISEHSMGGEDSDNYFEGDDIHNPILNEVKSARLRELQKAQLAGQLSEAEIKELSALRNEFEETRKRRDEELMGRAA